MADKISVSQRKYFVERIENSINEKIAELRQSNASDVQQISEREYQNYLKLLKIDKTMQEYAKMKTRFDVLSTRIKAVFDEVKNVFTKGKYDYNTPNLYSGDTVENVDKAFRWLCSQTAKQQESETTAGKLIRELETKKRAACDTLHGVNELEELKLTVNNILNGAGVPLLGE